MKVYFNNSCKICRSEINLYKKENIEEIDWIDITNNSNAEKETSKKDKELLRRLHVKDGSRVIEEQKLFFLYGKKFLNIIFCINFLNFQ
jgi:hypothetical protein